MIPHEVGIFADIDDVFGEPSDLFFPLEFGVFIAGNSSTAGLGSGSVLSINHGIL